MNRNNGTPWVRLIAGAALLGAAALAQAQYVWTDEKGLKQFSDRPPPPSVAPNRILKAPPPKPLYEIPGAQQEADAAPAEPAPKAAPTTAERNADYNKRKAEQAEQARRAAEDARLQSELAANCEAHRKNRALLESGARISTVGANGEPGYMSEAARASELATTQRALGACK